MFCPNCGKEVSDLAAVCVNCGTTLKNNTQIAKAGNDEVSVGLCIISFFIPIIGLIIWGTSASTTPKKAKACGISALVPIALYILYIIFCTLLAFLSEL